MTVWSAEHVARYLNKIGLIDHREEKEICLLGIGTEETASDVLCVGSETGDRDKIGVGVWYRNDTPNVNHPLFSQQSVIGLECGNGK